MPIYRHKNYAVNIGNDGEIVVQRGDWLSKYSAAIHAGDTTRVNEYGNKNKGVVEPIPSRNLVTGERIFHIPTYERWLDTNPKMKLKANAYRLIKECENRRSQAIAFKVISRFEVVEGLRERVNDPSRIDQGRAGLCPAASLIFQLATDKPDVYAQFVIDLFEKGVGRIGTWQVEPSNDLKMYQIPLSGSGGFKVHAADWIPMASIRDSENWFFDYQQIDEQWHWSINWLAQIVKSGGATFNELESWLKKAGYTEVIKGEGSTWPEDNQRTRGNIKLASDYYVLGYKIILRIDANILYLDWQARGENERSNHVVVLTSKVNFQNVGGRENLSMTVYTWGSGTHPIPLGGQLSVEDFLKYYYGFVAAKF
ncbi:MAG: hypothetical protein ABR927_17240 [Bacteroidales bacterium]|jgi:hypothetical protein